MYFKFEEDEEDSDDDLYGGVLPDMSLFRESKCYLCKENEKHWGRITTDLYTKKQFKVELKKYYETLIKSGTISMFVDLLSKIYPKPLNNYFILDHLLDLTSTTKKAKIKKKIEYMFELEEQIALEKCKLAMAIGKKQFTRELIEQVTERTRLAKLEVDKDAITESLLELKGHICDPKCTWCRKHCTGQDEHTTKGKLCDCKCTIFPSFAC